MPRIASPDWSHLTTPLAARTVLLAALVAVAFVLQPARARAESDVVITGHWPPYVDVSAPEGGLATAIVLRAMAEADMDTRLDITPLPWLRCEKLVREGLALAAYPYAKTPERAAYALFTAPIIHSRVVFFHAAGRLKDLAFTGTDSLEGLTVGGVKGYYYAERFADAGVEVTYFYDLDLAFKALAEGLIDVLPEDEVVGWARIGQLYPENTDRFATAPGALDSHDLHLMVSRAHPRAEAFVRRFDAGMEEVRAGGVVERLKAVFGVPAPQADGAGKNASQD